MSESHSIPLSGSIHHSSDSQATTLVPVTLVPASDAWYVKSSDIANTLMPLFTLFGFFFIWRQLKLTREQTEAAKIQAKNAAAQTRILEQQFKNQEEAVVRAQTVRVNPELDTPCLSFFIGQISSSGSGIERVTIYDPVLVANVGTKDAFNIKLKVTIMSGTQEIALDEFRVHKLEHGQDYHFNFQSRLNISKATASFEDPDGQLFYQEWAVNGIDIQPLSGPGLIPLIEMPQSPSTNE